MLIVVATAFAAPVGPAVPPPNRLAGWEAPVVTASKGTRVAMIVEARDPVPVVVEVADGSGWRRAERTWQRGRVSVHVAELSAPRAALRFRSPDAGRIVLVDWDLFTPSAGEPRRAVTTGAPPPTPGVLPSELEAIGVTSRSAWGADATTCSTTEDDWYRMAIHHTAGSQTYGGSVQGAVQALQAYSLGTGEYCDIPYQFLVGYDGSLWEGRPYDYYSGATGGGNNDGNIAVCFLGCYHPTDCSTSHAVTDAMMEGGQLLVQTLAGLHSVASDEDSIRGHRDWPDNATACPGEWLYERLDELRAPLGPDFGATASALVCGGGDGSLSLLSGETGSCSLSLLNVGAASWSPGLTKLAPIPRDGASVLAASSWLNATRVASVAAATAPGAVGSFTFDVYAPAAGDYVLSLGLLEEGVTWFADDGGPADGAIAVTVSVRDPEGGETGLGDSGTAADSGSLDSGSLGPAPPAPPRSPGSLVPLETLGCGCGVTTSGGPGVGLAALLALGLARARGRVDRRGHDGPAASPTHRIAPGTSNKNRPSTSRSTHSGINGWNLLSR